MSGKRNELIDFHNLFRIFENLEREQFSKTQELLKTNGISLRFYTQKENAVNGLFGPTYASENYDYTGIHHLLNSSCLFAGINNYCSQKSHFSTPLDCLNKIYIHSSDLVEIFVPQINLKREETMFSFSYEDKCPLSNKDLIKKIIDEGYLDLHIKIIKANPYSKIGFDESNWRRSSFDKDGGYSDFKDIVELKLFEIQNILKKDVDSRIISYIFSLSREEKKGLALLKHEEKSKLLYDNYCGKFDIVWLYCYFHCLKNLNDFNKDIEFNQFLSIVENDYSSIKENAKIHLDKIENNKLFKVFKDDQINSN